MLAMVTRTKDKGACPKIAECDVRRRTFQSPSLCCFQPLDHDKPFFARSNPNTGGEPACGRIMSKHSPEYP